MDRFPSDFDVAVEGPIEPVVQFFCAQLKVNPLRHDRFGTATFRGETEQIDITRTRSETYPAPAKLPVVTFNSIQSDLRRRDFSINAIALLINHDRPGLILDPFRGIDDIKHKLIRVLHQRSFIDDPTRIFRALRYKNRLGFTIESTTKHLLRQALDLGMIDLLSGQRIMNEYRLIFRENDYLKTLRDLSRLKIQDFPANRYKILNRLGDLKIYYFLSQTRKLSCPLSTDEKKIVQDFKNVKRLLRLLTIVKTNSDIFRLLSRFSLPVIKCLPAFDRQATLKVKTYLKLIRSKPLIDGHDLKRLNLPPGPRYRRILERLFFLQLDGRIRTKNEAHKWLEHVRP